MLTLMETCVWCQARFPRAEHAAHYRKHLGEVQQLRQEVHGEVEPVDRFLADLMA
jgi:hypothetical protein